MEFDKQQVETYTFVFDAEEAAVMMGIMNNTLFADCPLAECIWVMLRDAGIDENEQERAN